MSFVFCEGLRLVVEEAVDDQGPRHRHARVRSSHAADAIVQAERTPARLAHPLQQCVFSS